MSDEWEWKPRPHRHGEEEGLTAFAWKIPIVCTDRRQHKRTVIAFVEAWVNDEGERVRAMRHLHVRRVQETSRDHWAEPYPPALDGSGESRASYQFGCPRCPRRVRIDGDRWWRSVRAWFEANADPVVAAGARASQLPDMDISLLS